jgi:Mg/Co/Ni transporter MgtE
MSAMKENQIPLLTDVVHQEDAGDGDDASEVVEDRSRDELIAELQTRIASRTFELTDELMRAAFSEMEAKIYQQILSSLRQALPEIIDSLLREHLPSEDAER